MEVLVQEPDSQLLRLVVQDVDLLNITELLRVNIIKGATNLLRSANPIGHAALPLREVCAAPNKRHELELRWVGLVRRGWCVYVRLCDMHGQLLLSSQCPSPLRHTPRAPLAHGPCPPSSPTHATSSTHTRTCTSRNAHTHAHRLAGSEWAYELGVSGGGDHEEDGGRLSIAVTYAPFRDLDARSSAPINCRCGWGRVLGVRGDTSSQACRQQA